MSKAVKACRNADALAEYWRRLEIRRQQKVAEAERKEKEVVRLERMFCVPYWTAEERAEIAKELAIAQSELDWIRLELGFPPIDGASPDEQISVDVRKVGPDDKE